MRCAGYVTLGKSSGRGSETRRLASHAKHATCSGNFSGNAAK